ncbi:MAG: DNA helicase RecQ [Cytophagaceae bacterium]|jgi:ATP-dependent DNA helicase RecQ|nr:DNA helicase RecQ [Cytophagaceae bacterium]
MSVLIDHDIEVINKLKSVFGYDRFRGNQEAIINNVMAGNNTFVIMPTGAGKSLCYQLPAISMPGTAVVISPLIALMKNQVDQLNAFGINAQFLNSTLTKAEMTKVKKETLSGEVKLLYVAPESLTKEDNITFLKKARVSFVAIDEAHCISEWGHDFRPEYRKIRTIIDSLGPNIPIIALTATATPKVQIDIQKNLQMDDATIFKSSFNRTNLFYEVRPKGGTKKKLIKFVKSQKGASGIIYCLSRKKVEEIAELLKVNDVRALPYHAGLDSHVRMHNQDAFLNEEADVIVATIAFGMGIDKPDVRFVVHYDTPKSLEGYYQETGRAGRDGIDAHCLMFYSANDVLKLEKFNKDKPVTERDNAKHLLHEISSYAESSVCRRRQLLYYFGETMDKDCGYCDNCKSDRTKFTVQEEVITALQSVLLTEERFSIHHLCSVIAGIENEYALSYKHTELPVYGKGKEQSITYWNSIFRQLLLHGLLEKDEELFGNVKMTSKGIAYLKQPYPMELYADHNFEAEAEAELEEDNSQIRQACDDQLMDMLKALRKKVAKDKNIPPYAVFQDPSLEEMATTYPTTKEDLSRIVGVGMGKVNKFGKPFIDLITQYVADNEIVTAKDVVVKSSVDKSKIKIYLIQQIDRKVDLEEIASSKQLTFSDVLQEIEHICYSGTRLNLDYYIDQVVDGDKQDEIYDYFMQAENDNIREALKTLGDTEYSEEEIRLMRVKFLSEVAN